MTPEDLSVAVRDALIDAIAAGEVSSAVEPPRAVGLERPRAGERGDWSTNVALRLAREAGLPPFELAGILARSLGAHPGVRGVGVAGPGFLNVTLASGSAGLATDVLAADGARVGRARVVAGRRIEIATCVSGARVLAPAGGLDAGPDASTPMPMPTRMPTPTAGAPESADPAAAARLRRSAYVADALERMLVAGGAQVTRTTTTRPGRAPGQLLVTDGGVVDTIAVGPLLLDDELSGAGAPVEVDDPGNRDRAGDRVGDGPLPAPEGEDALRLWVLRAAPTAPVEVGAAQVRRRGAGNPAYVLGHAHARLATLLERLPVQARTGAASAPPDPALLVHATETRLLGGLHDVDRVLALAIRRRDPSRLVRHLETLAEQIDAWLAACPPRPPGDRAWREVHRSRLALAAAARGELARGLDLLGAQAPRRL
ncbi:DALR anticodon-binding domain-containing protein [Agilicoccus flavus]|uniref:DALR anticodon-binding domain-containing protein n=1 Tax=Agilicoccus flavus TaxID=2775968 RepID=UPI001CF62EBA|nr:DALR anticodon-binding domain-containing protein [Agilicoccus flavus]